MPSLGNPKNRKYNCTSNGVLRLISMYTRTICRATGTRANSMPAHIRPTTSARIMPIMEMNNVISMPFTKKGA